MDVGYFLGVTLIALLCLPALYALHAPAWSAGIVAGICLWQQGPWLAVPVASLICVWVGRCLFERAWRIQAFAVSLMVLVWLSSWLYTQPYASPHVVALLTGFSLGLFSRLSLRGSEQLYRVAAICLLFFVAAVHPGLWGGTPFARLMTYEYMGGVFSVVLFAVALQMGAGVRRRIAIQEAKRGLQVAREEFSGLMDRLIPKHPLPA